MISRVSGISPSEGQLAEINLALKECGYCLDEKLREAIVFASK